MPIQKEPDCDRCEVPFGDVVACSFVVEGKQVMLNACENCRPDAHYGVCDGCSKHFLHDKLRRWPLDYPRLMCEKCIKSARKSTKT